MSKKLEKHCAACSTHFNLRRRKLCSHSADKLPTAAWFDCVNFQAAVYPQNQPTYEY